MSAPIIGLMGLAQSGKSTAAQYLEREHGFVRVRFAGPLKAMCRAIGLSDREIEGEGKEVPHPLLCGKTPRFVMQTLGTEWGREIVGPDFWTGIWRESVIAALDEGAKGIIAEDCRFPNEVEAIREAGGKLWRIERAEQSVGAHVSEWAASGVTPDLLIRNVGTVEELLAACGAEVSHVQP
jgi:hypothetical protein